MDNRKHELGGLTEPIEMLVKRGMDSNMSSGQMAMEIAKAISGNKETRAEPVAIQVNNGNVGMVKAHWNAEFIREISNFPYSKNDDQVDALADAFDELAKVRVKRFFAV